MTLKVVNMPNQDPPDGAQAASASTGSEGAPAAGQAPTTSRTSWHERVRSATRWSGRQLGRPRVRLVVVGIALLLAGLLWITSSMWTLPLIVAGIVMVMIAWVGSRLDGRFAVQWGESGTQVEFRAQIKAPPAAAHGVQLHPLPAAAPPAPAIPPAAPAPVRPQIDDGGVIEGEGHTVEIDVAELRSLIRAAEAQESAAAAGDDDGTAGQRSVA